MMISSFYINKFKIAVKEYSSSMTSFLMLPKSLVSLSFSGLNKKI